MEEQQTYAPEPRDYRAVHSWLRHSQTHTEQYRSLILEFWFQASVLQGWQQWLSLTCQWSMAQITHASKWMGHIGCSRTANLWKRPWIHFFTGKQSLQMAHVPAIHLSTCCNARTKKSCLHVLLQAATGTQTGALKVTVPIITWESGRRS